MSTDKSLECDSCSEPIGAANGTLMEVEGMKRELDKFQEHFLSKAVDLSFVLKPVGKELKKEFGLSPLWDSFEKKSGKDYTRNVVGGEDGGYGWIR